MSSTPTVEPFVGKQREQEEGIDSQSPSLQQYSRQEQRIMTGEEVVEIPS
jgi:hypothetical protein